MLDQAASLRSIVSQMSAEVQPCKTSIITILGVQAQAGKKSFAANFAVALAKLGKSVLVVNLGEDSHVFAGALQVDRYAPLADYLQGEKRLEEVVRLGAVRVKFLDGAQAWPQLLQKSNVQVKKAEQKLCVYCQDCDYIIFVAKDCCVESQNDFLSACDDCFVVTGLAPAAIVDCFKLFKQNAQADCVRLVVSKQSDSVQTRETVDNFLKVVEKTVGFVPKQMSWLFYDEKAALATSEQLYDLQQTGAWQNIQAIAQAFLEDEKKSCTGLGKFLANMRKE